VKRTPAAPLTTLTTQFVMCVRDPVKRAYSNWNMQLQVPGGSGIEDLSFPEAIERELSGLMGEKRVYGTALYHYVQRGLYMDQIERFLKVPPCATPPPTTYSVAHVLLTLNLIAVPSVRPLCLRAVVVVTVVVTVVAGVP